MEYKFNVGDKVKVVRSGSGFGNTGDVVTIVERGIYVGDPGYRVDPPLGNSAGGYLFDRYKGMNGEKSFELVEKGIYLGYELVNPVIVQVPKI